MSETEKQTSEATFELDISEQLREMENQPISKIKEASFNLDQNIRFCQQIIDNMERDIKSKEAEFQQYDRVIKDERNKTPMAVGHVAEVFPFDEGKEEGEGSRMAKYNAVVAKTSFRQYFLPMSGFVKASELEPSDTVGLRQSAHSINRVLPANFDPRVKSMELDSKPTETYDMIGGLEKQIQELNEAVILPMKSPEKFERLGIKVPKGVLLHGPPGTGKTMLARACAAATDASFFRLSGSSIVQSHYGEGPKLVRQLFDLARKKAPAIIFIDEIDAVGGKRGDDDHDNGGREVGRTLLELLNQLDGFTALENVKFICATNRPDILDPALMRSGRIDRKIEFPLPNEAGREQILKIHSKKLNVADDVDFGEIARSTEDFNGAMLRGICVEAGMSALRRGDDKIHHEDYVEGINAVQATKHNFLDYFT